MSDNDLSQQSFDEDIDYHASNVEVLENNLDPKANAGILDKLHLHLDNVSTQGN